MMNSSLRELSALVEAGWGNVPVLVVGDVMLDQYVWGDVDRISPEAPVPVVRATLREEKPGGAANVAMNLSGLGAQVTVIGFGGGDREQATLEQLLVGRGIEPVLIAVPASPTTCKLRILSGNQQMMRLDRDAASTASALEYESLLSAILSVLPKAAVVVLSDYAKGVLRTNICQTVIGEAQRRNIPILVDPKSRSFTRYRGATMICPNLKELAIASGEPVYNIPRLLSAGQALVQALDLQSVVVTLGEKGIAVLQHNSQIHAPAVARQVYDVSGAGDTVIAVLALALARGVNIEAAVQLANIAAGVVVSKVGTVPIQREELLGALAQEIAPSMDDKVMPLDRVITRVAMWRSSQRKIVFTNGCFDILHIGHIRLLEEARRRGDRLIVGLNSDASVRELKGRLRPIVGQAERARILAALSAVDAVVIFEEPTPLRLIETLRPEVLVKGGDYSEENVVGAREVRAWGGRVELIPLVPGISTTRLIAETMGAAALQPANSIFSA